MYLATVLFAIFSAWKWGDWKNWLKYHSTMMYMAMGNLLYDFLYYDHWLWLIKQHFMGNYVIADALMTFIILPITCLIFLTDYPDTIKGQIFRIIKFITIYFLFEVGYYIHGIIVYNYGWNIWWSLAWDFMMFPMLALHYKKPLVAYGASIMAVIIMLIIFPVSFK
jgi:hypothetical protein